MKKNGLLELIETKETLDSIGGLDVLKEWLLKRRHAFSQRAIEYGLPSPKGLLILGIAGTGKSLTAKATAKVFGVPLLKLDAGRIFAGLVGQSESNLRAVIQTAEAISFKTSSATGAQIAMGQYANIPPWGDEYKETELKDANIKGVIHSGFNREMPSKWSEDGRIRTIRTNFLVTGETTCENAATMSRFVSTVAAREKRSGTAAEQLVRLNWLQDHRRWFFAIGRAVLQQRARFAGRVMGHLADWEKLPELAQSEPRGRLTYGVSYAAFLALNEIIPIYTKDKCVRFQEWLIERTVASGREVAERVSVFQFWRVFLNALAMGALGETPG